jgi:hypothetical protein
MEALLINPNGWLTGLVGVIIGAAASWAITSHYASKAPQWAIEMREDIKTMQADGDVDFVAEFEKALKDHDIVLDGGSF